MQLQWSWFNAGCSLQLFLLSGSYLKTFTVTWLTSRVWRRIYWLWTLDHRNPVKTYSWSLRTSVKLLKVTLKILQRCESEVCGNRLNHVHTSLRSWWSIISYWWLICSLTVTLNASLGQLLLFFSAVSWFQAVLWVSHLLWTFSTWSADRSLINNQYEHFTSS